MPKVSKSNPPKVTPKPAATPPPTTSGSSAAPKKRTINTRGITGPLIIKKEDGREFIPVVGSTAQYHDRDTDIYADVLVHKVEKARRKCVVSFIGKNAHEKPKVGRFVIDAVDLDVPMNPNINQRFEYFEKITRMALHQKLRSTLVLGEGGLGKTHTIEKIAKEEGIDMEEIPTMKGNTTARGLFNFLKDNDDKLCFLDDCDSVFTDRVAGNILKAALDSRRTRRITWMTDKGKDTITFSGSIVFISNLPKSSFETATLSRATVIDLFMTPEEKIERFRAIAPHIEVDDGLKLDLGKRMDIIDIMDKYKHSILNLNARSLVKAFNIMSKTDDINLVQYQILNS